LDFRNYVWLCIPLDISWYDLIINSRLNWNLLHTFDIRISILFTYLSSTYFPITLKYFIQVLCKSSGYSDDDTTFCGNSSGSGSVSWPNWILFQLLKTVQAIMARKRPLKLKMNGKANKYFRKSKFFARLFSESALINFDFQKILIFPLSSSITVFLPSFFLDIWYIDIFTCT
jgi:hypothetical protein